MVILCLDLEGVLIPEIWIEFSKLTGIAELARTTRDEPDYDKLMRARLDLLARHKLGLPDIHKVIEGMQPLPGAREFLDAMRSRFQVVILSDTFSEFARPLMRRLGWPTLFCQWLDVAADGVLLDYRLRMPEFFSIRRRASPRSFRSFRSRKAIRSSRRPSSPQPRSRNGASQVVQTLLSSMRSTTDIASAPAQSSSPITR